MRTKLAMFLAVMMMTGLSQAVNAQQTTKEKEGIKIIREGDDGEVQVLTKQKEVTTTGEEKTTKVVKQPVVSDDTPRKARVMVTPAVWQKEYRRKLDRELNEKWGITDPGTIENPGFTSYLTDALVNTRKFDMLEREDLKTIVKELDFGETEYVDVKKVQKIGGMMGADYAVIPEIRYIMCASESKTTPYVNTKQNILTCKIATAVRTVDVSSGKIIAFNISETEKKVRPRDEGDDKKRLALVDLISETQKECGLKEAANLVDVAYPIKIMGVTEDTVMLNRGKGAIIEGEILNVYAAGEMMIDPDTKENLGFHEAMVGKIKVTEVNNKTCQAKIVEKSEAIKKLYVCRRLSNAQKIEELKNGNTPPPKID